MAKDKSFDLITVEVEHAIYSFAQCLRVHMQGFLWQFRTDIFIISLRGVILWVKALLVFFPSLDPLCSALLVACRLTEQIGQILDTRFKNPEESRSVWERWGWLMLCPYFPQWIIENLLKNAKPNSSMQSQISPEVSFFTLWINDGPWLQWDKLFVVTHLGH